ncbi:MAG: hypothetical protein RIA64_01820 [Rhodospirillales bacterium]
MATSVGSVVIDLGLESASFSRNVAKANSDLSRATTQMRLHMRSVDRAARDMSRQFGQLKSAAAAFAGVLAVRQFTQFTKSAIETGDALAKQSRQLGIAASELQRYRIEGDLAGVATEKLESGIGAFVKRVGELRAGTGTLVTILDKSNVALKEQLLAAKDTGEGIDIILKAIREAETAFDKQALSAAAFGRQAGQAMVLLAEEAGKLDGQMVNLVTRSDEMLAASERLNDEFTLFQSALSAGFDNAIVTGFAGSLDVTVESMRSAREVGETFGKAVGASMRALITVAKTVAENMRGITAAIAGLVALKAATLFTGIATATATFATATLAAARAQGVLNTIVSKSVLGAIAKLAITLGAGALSWAAFGKEADAAAKAVDAAAKDIADSLSGAGGATQFVGAQQSAFDQLQESLVPAIKAQREYAEGVKALDAAVEAGKISFMDYNLMLETLQMNLDEATKGTIALSKAQKEAADASKAAKTENTRIAAETQAIMDGAKAWEDYKKSREVDQEVTALKKDLESAGLAADEIKRLTEERRFLLQVQQEAIEQHEQEQTLYRELEQVGSRAFDRIGAAVTEMFVQGKSSAFEWKNVLLGVISEIQQAFIELALNQAKASAFGGGGFLSSILAGFFGGGGSAVAGASGMSAIGSSVPMAFLADGGPAKANTPYIVGEEGPELFVPNVSGQVVPNDRLVSGSGMSRVSSGVSEKSGDTYVIDARGADREGLARLEKMIQSINGSIEKRAVGAVADAQRRGRPAMRGAFG